MAVNNSRLSGGNLFTSDLSSVLHNVVPQSACDNTSILHDDDKECGSDSNSSNGADDFEQTCDEGASYVADESLDSGVEDNGLNDSDIRESDTVNVELMTSDLPRDILDNDLLVSDDLNDPRGLLMEHEDWRAKERHVFILSSSGKPVYSRYGSEDKMVTLFGVMQALVSIVEDSDDVMESIHFGKSVIVFHRRGPIILVAVSKNRDSVVFLNNQLTYVYNQIVSVLTLMQINRIFETRQNYDLRRLLSGSERLIDHLLQFHETEPSVFVGGISCIPMPPSQRESISSAIVSTCSKIKNLVFAVLVANNRLITLVRKKRYSMSPSDLHLILNMVASSESLKTAEIWTPICLPHFNANGFLHAHVSYLTEDTQACLLLLTVDQEIFFQLSEAKRKLTEKLKKNNSISVIDDVLKTPPSMWFSLHEIGVSKIRHFIYKCRRTNNVMSSPLQPPYDTPEDANKLLTKYQTVYYNMMDSNPQVQGFYQDSAEESVICLITEKFDILVALEPIMKKQAALDLITKLTQWIQKEEDKFFVSNIPYL